MHAAVKYISEEIHPFEIAFFRCAFVIIILSPMIFYQGKSILVTKNPKLQIYRIGLNSIALLNIFAINLTLDTFQPEISPLKFLA